MKKVFFTLAIFFLALSFGTSSVNAADVVGSESYQVCWNDVQNTANGGYQLIFGQANTGSKDSAVGGLSSNSRCVTLNSLKACTTYIWNLRRNDAGVFSWQWAQDRRFTTAGRCAMTGSQVGSTITTSNGSHITVVGKGSATVSWPVVNGAQFYNVYYRASTDSMMQHSVQVSPKSNSVTINYLDPAKTYYYRVGAMVNGHEVWQPEQMMQKAQFNQVLGATTDASTVAPEYLENLHNPYKPTQVLGDRVGGALAMSMTQTAPASSVMGGSCSVTGTARISWTAPNRAIAKYHVLYGSDPTNLRHAVRDLDQSARELTIGALSTCKTYYYQVLQVGTSGRVTMTPVLPMPLSK